MSVFGEGTPNNTPILPIPKQPSNDIQNIVPQPILDTSLHLKIDLTSKFAEMSG
jgi:hypothetical protein